LRDSSDDPLIVAGLLNGNISATRTPREILRIREENARKTTGDHVDVLRLS
jgi:hypothetical protein